MNDIKQGGSSTPQKPKGHVDFKSAFYFQTPVWIAEAPMFLKNTIKLTDKYIKKADKLLKDKLKNEPKWKKDIGTFGLSKHSESFSQDPKEYKGGELEFDLRNLDPDKKPNLRSCTEILPKGSLVVFPSFVWHRVKPVTKGERNSLVIWNLGYPFK